MKKSIDCGANLINDIYSLRKGALEVVADSDTHVCLMHERRSAKYAG